jgi:hypothetical protein
MEVICIYSVGRESLVFKEQSCFIENCGFRGMVIESILISSFSVL